MMTYTREYYPHAICLLSDGSPFRLNTGNEWFQTLEDAKEVISLWYADSRYTLLISWIDTKCISEWEAHGKQMRNEQINKVGFKEYPNSYWR